MSSNHPDFTASERKTLVDILADNRTEILEQLEGLTADHGGAELTPAGAA